MQSYRIYSYKYGIDISMLIISRFSELTSEFSVLTKTETTLEICFADKEKEHFIYALCEVLLCDIAQFELADMVNELEPEPDLQKKRSILLNAVTYARKAAMRIPVRRALSNYFSESNTLTLEGFVTFRMPETLEIWVRCVEKSAEDIILLEEQYELASLLFELLRNIPDRTEASLIVHKDGTFTVTDNFGTHIDYPDQSGILNFLTAISPEIITVYDMVGNRKSELIMSIESMFPSKVRIFSSIYRT